jgi:hypothetical protein
MARTRRFPFLGSSPRSRMPMVPSPFEFRGTRRAGTSVRPVWFALACLAPAACGEGTSATLGDWAVDTLASGIVRTTNPGVPSALEGAPVGLEPVLRLGAAGGPDATVFGQVSGVEADEEGRIYVLDRQANELQIFSPEGEHLRTVGRSGSGPGEYSAANGLRWAAPDTLLVVDQSGGRYTFLTRDGDYARSVRRELGYFGWMFDGAILGDRVYELGIVATPDGSEAAIIGIPTGDDAARGDTIPVPRTEQPAASSFSVRGEAGGMSMAVPFAARRVLHIDPEGRLWHGHGSEMRIFRSTLDGDTLREIRADIRPTPVTSAEMEEWLAGASVERFIEMGGDLDTDRIPDTKPHFDQLYVDAHGHLWVSVPAGPGDTRFAVFDREGRFVSDLRLDGVRRTPAVPPAVRGDRLYLATLDELDVPGVAVFEIER